MSRRWLTISILVSGFYLASTLPYRRVVSRIDPVTGSMKYETRRFFVCVSRGTEQSAIERWILRHEGVYSSTWRSLSDTSCFAIDGPCFSCSRAPEIFPLRTGDLNDDFVRRASDAEIAALVRIMRGGTAAERERAVESACEKALGDPGRDN